MFGSEWFAAFNTVLMLECEQIWNCLLQETDTVVIANYIISTLGLSVLF